MQTLSKTENGESSSAPKRARLWSNLLNKLIDNCACHLGLSLTRIGFFAVAFASVLQLFLNRYITFAPDKMWVANYMLPLDLIALAGVVLGFKTRACLIINYFVFRFEIYPCLQDLWHFDYLVGALSFVFLFSPSPKTLSIDSWLKKVNRPLEQIPLSFVLLLSMALGLTYLDSIIFKTASLFWTSGQMFWISAAIPFASTRLYPEWLEIGWLCKLSTIAALAFETFFPLILFRYFRPIFCFLGIVLHLGISLFMPIAHFGWAMVFLYFPFINFKSLLKKSAALEQRGEPSKAEFPPALCYGLSVIMLAAQLSLIFVPDNKRPQLCNLAINVMSLYRHPVYQDWHFTIKYPICRFTTEVNGKTYEIPSYTEDCYPLVQGRYWVAHSFYMRAPVDGDYMKRYVHGWFKQMRLPVSPVKILCHEAWIERTPEPDFTADNKMRAKPWKFAGMLYGDSIVWEKDFLTKYPLTPNTKDERFE